MNVRPNPRRALLLALGASGLPPPRNEVIVAAPGPDFFWIAGYWAWLSGRHVWMGGRWEANRPGWRWAPHSWQRRGRGWHAAPGRWERR